MKKNILLLSLATALSLNAGSYYYPSLFSIKDSDDNIGFKNIASLENIQKNNNEFRFYTDRTLTTLNKFPGIAITYSDTLINSDGTLSRGVLPDATTTDTTTSTNNNSGVTYWCADNWNRVKVYVPKGITKVDLLGSVIPSISDLRFHIAFKRSDATNFTVDHSNFIKNSSYSIFNTLEEYQENKKQKLRDLLQNGKTIEITGVGNFSFLTLDSEQISEFLDTDGWLYISVVNDKQISAEVLKSRTYQSSSTIYFNYSFEIDETGYSNFLSSLDVDGTGNPKDTSATNEVEVTCNNITIPTATPVPTATPSVFDCNKVGDMGIGSGWNLIGGYNFDLTKFQSECNPEDVWVYESGKWSHNPSSIKNGQGFWLKK